MVTVNASRELEPIELHTFATRFRDGMRVLFADSGMVLDLQRPREYDIYTTPMHPSEWSSILLNFLTNSMKAIRRAGVAGKMLIRTGKTKDDNVWLEFADNGDGIPAANRERVFDAFFSTTSAPPAHAPAYAHAVGTGLGLKIVWDIASGIDGTVTVVEPPEGYATCFRVVVPAASEDELP